ncbi:MAG: hypothetical protein SOZ28_03710 [Clostridia bacterium]|nr:hypothetical protein [Clostridia bacterium]
MKTHSHYGYDLRKTGLTLFAAFKKHRSSSRAKLLIQGLQKLPKAADKEPCAV